MPTYQSIIEKIKGPQEAFVARQELIKQIEKLTGRRLLVYVADINKPESILRPEDKTGFSDLIQGVNETEVDFLINSPGGFAEVTESIVSMLRSKFKNIRFAIPNMAKSAATLLVLSGDMLLMDHRSELGPIDPQVAYRSIDGQKNEAAEDILDGFDAAKDALVKNGPAATPAYVPLLNKYTIGLLQSCKNAMKLSRELAETWLKTYMFYSNPEKSITVAEYFASHGNTLSHNRAIGVEKCLELEMKIVDLRKAEHTDLAEKLWQLWCLFELHFERTPVYKIYENSTGCSFQKQLTAVPIRPPQMPIPIPGPLPKPRDRKS
jgi:hypothetical protein